MSSASPAERSSHWDEVYATKDESEMSWPQLDPALSLELIGGRCPRGGAVLDVGGGTSRLAARLVERLDARVTVLDLSSVALERSRKLAGAAGERIQWLCGDVGGAPWPVTETFDVWHDRAVLHFLIEPEQLRAYVERVCRHVRPGGHAVIATFAPDGPERCSGLEVRRYDAPALAALFAPAMSLVETRRELHVRPRGGEQPFTYVVLRRDAR